MHRSIVILALLPLAGCITFGAKPPPSLLTLSADSPVVVGQSEDSANAKTITVMVPATPQALATTRVPVQAGPTSIAYVKDAEWSEPPANLFARLVADTMKARTGRVVLSGAQYFADPGARLTGELRNFGLDATARQAVVTFDASLIRADSPAVETRRFEAKVPVSAIDASSAATGLSQAANQVAVQLADWVGR